MMLYHYYYCYQWLLNALQSIIEYIAMLGLSESVFHCQTGEDKF